MMYHGMRCILRRSSLNAWPVIMFTPGGLALALWYIVEGDK